MSPLLTRPSVGTPLVLETVGSPSNVSPANKNPAIGTLSGSLKPPPVLLKKSTLSKGDGELPRYVASECASGKPPGWE